MSVLHAKGAAACQRAVLAVVIGAAPIQALQFRRLIVEYAATTGAMFYDMESALNWTVQQKPPKSAQR